MVQSPAFGDGDAIPARFTCDGEGVSPPIRWAAPEGAPNGLDYAVLMVDVDAPGEKFVHWLVYGLSSDGTIPEGGPVHGSQGRNTFGEQGYGGPCPPPGDDPHRYEFRLYALRSPPTPQLPGLSVDDLLGGVPDEPALATLTGTYGRG
ncbi:MAG TPA: YbhB/YbcL family Raf kinase inhibitor-like protein [Actinomycetota bacterium]